MTASALQAAKLALLAAGRTKLCGSSQHACMGRCSILMSGHCLGISWPAVALAPLRSCSACM